MTDILARMLNINNVNILRNTFDIYTLFAEWINIFNSLLL